jgi:hypothetical protein
MGGGKTHNMIALALLAENREWRRRLVSSSSRLINRRKAMPSSPRKFLVRPILSQTAFRYSRISACISVAARPSSRSELKYAISVQ